jgi:hypothetical protein
MHTLPPPPTLYKGNYSIFVSLHENRIWNGVQNNCAKGSWGEQNEVLLQGTNKKTTTHPPFLVFHPIMMIYNVGPIPAQVDIKAK